MDIEIIQQQQQKKNYISPTASLLLFIVIIITVRGWTQQQSRADKISFSQTLVEIPPKLAAVLLQIRQIEPSRRCGAEPIPTTRSCFSIRQFKKNWHTKASVLHFSRCRWSYQRGAAWEPPVDTRGASHSRGFILWGMKLFLVRRGAPRQTEEPPAGVLKCLWKEKIGFFF